VDDGVTVGVGVGNTQVLLTHGNPIEYVTSPTIIDGDFPQT
jgi:hypothetical protein